MALKNQYFCKKLADYVKPEILSSRAQGGLAIVVGLDCNHLSSGFCKEYGRACRPYKKAQKEARYDNRKHAQIPLKKDESPGMAAHNLLGDRGQYSMGSL